VGDQFTTHIPGDLRVSYAMTYSDTDHYFVGTERQDGPGQVEETVAPATLGFDNVLGLEYDLPRGFTLALEVPFVHTEQSREFGGVQGTMEANGLGDIRALGRYWFRQNPAGLTLHGAVGVRLPTGESDRKFRAQNGTMVTQDLAAQPGTGNAAGIVEVGGSYFFGQRFGLGFTTRYIYTPAATTVNNFRNELTGSGPAKNSDSDAFTTRLGLATTLSTGTGFLNRISGQAIFDFAWVPYDDLIGDTEGFRRAGVILALGPGLSYTPLDRITVSAALPVTLYRDVQHNGGNVQEVAFQLGVTVDAIRL
jgi:hypothetical protein